MSDSSPSTSAQSVALDDQTSGVVIEEVMQRLDEMYGPRVWESRGEPVDVLVETVLSQNTSDVNSARAFRLLVERFGSLETVASAPVEEIEQAISRAGLSRIKSARIRKMLARLLAEERRTRSCEHDRAARFVAAVTSIDHVSYCFASGEEGTVEIDPHHSAPLV